MPHKTKQEPKKVNNESRNLNVLFQNHSKMHYHEISKRQNKQQICTQNNLNFMI